MKKIVIVNLLILSAFNLTGQRIDVSRINRIKSIRREIGNSIQKNDLGKVKEITDNDYRICDVREDCFPMLRMTEKIHIDFLLSDFSKMISVNMFENYWNLNTSGEKIYIPSFKHVYLDSIFKGDSLTDILKKQLIVREDNIILNIYNTNLREKNKDYLILLLKYVIAEDNPCNKDYETDMFKSAENFLLKYKNTDNEYMRSVIKNMDFIYADSK